jgi:hypothetical protein
MSDNQPFTYTDLGDHKAELTGGLLVPGGGPLTITGNTLTGLTGGELDSISLTEIDGHIYKWQIEVVGRADVIGGDWHLDFTDETKDTYSLLIMSPIVENHYVDFNSSEPSINTIKWRKGG